MSYPWLTKAMLEDRISASRVTRIYDDNLDGTADTNPIAQLLADACSKVAGALNGAFSLAALTASTPHEVIRISLDVAQAYAAQRFPEVYQVEWVELLKAADRDLMNLRKNVTTLDTDAAPMPPANVGGEVFPNPATESVYSFARDGFGDF